MKGLASELRKYKHVFVVCDSNVEYFARQVAGIPSGAERGGMPLLAITADEGHKTIDTVMQICRWLLEQGADRNAMVLAVGGGVTTDMAGFAACIYKRGVRYANVPTTLLSTRCSTTFSTAAGPGRAPSRRPGSTGRICSG